MTKTFERFLRSFSDEDLVSFARERAALQPPYWRTLQVALRIEMDRRGIEAEPVTAGAARREHASA